VVLAVGGLLWWHASAVSNYGQKQRDHQDIVWRAEIAKANEALFVKQQADAARAQQDAIDRGVAAGIREAETRAVVKEIKIVTPANCVYDERSAALLNSLRKR